MKLRSVVLVALGVGAGYAISRKMHEDDPAVVRGPQRSTSPPGLRIVSDQAQRIADQASVRSVEVIRRARGAIRTRLGEPSTYDEAAWN
jgi:hypothetical protein